MLTTIINSGEEGIVKIRMRAHMWTHMRASDILKSVVTETPKIQYLAANILEANWRWCAKKMELIWIHIRFAKIIIVNIPLWIWDFGGGGQNIGGRFRLPVSQINSKMFWKCRSPLKKEKKT